ncbi:hypothetical protein [Rhizobium sp. TRM95796]|uniref:hypothetical protein n=1 Tax=Rhizobium sp. TRM95796 TaxID=2979862 RepID=UPI0021E98DFB|nr:hypothetical protein [Rhizobium sp. TRM95796]MCV3765680.1 hypothetical protein [Rhizobium sp. TRM95796]
MASTFITSSTATPVTVTGNFSSVAILAGATVFTTDAAVSLPGSSTSRSVLIDGHLLSTIGGGVTLGSTDDFNFLTFASVSDQIVIGRNGGILAGGSGIGGFATSMDLFNAGSIVGGLAGVAVTGDKNAVINRGEMSGVNAAISLVGDSCSLVNSGDLSSVGVTVSLNGAGISLKNTGVIAAASGEAVTLSGDIDGFARIQNSGTIDGSVAETSADATFVNTGLITGDVALGAGADTLRLLSGLIAGSVDAGEGDDVIFLGAGDYEIFGGAGTDTLSSARSFALSGGVENLILRGADALRGLGNGDANVITGNRGDNILRGLGGRDVLNGGAGDDLLIGGSVKDGVRDTFVFSLDCGADRIRGFQIKGAGDDRIDISDFAQSEAFDSFVDLKTNVMRQSGKNVILDLPGDDQVTIENVTRADFRASDFIF